MATFLSWDNIIRLCFRIMVACNWILSSLEKGDLLGLQQLECSWHSGVAMGMEKMGKMLGKKILSVYMSYIPIRWYRVAVCRLEIPSDAVLVNPVRRLWGRHTSRLPRSSAFEVRKPNRCEEHLVCPHFYAHGELILISKEGSCVCEGEIIYLGLLICQTPSGFSSSCSWKWQNSI